MLEWREEHWLDKQDRTWEELEKLHLQWIEWAQGLLGKEVAWPEHTLKHVSHNCVVPDFLLAWIRGCEIKIFPWSKKDQKVFELEDSKEETTHA